MELKINMNDLLQSIDMNNADNNIRGVIKYSHPAWSAALYVVDRSFVNSWKKNKDYIKDLVTGKSIYILESVNNDGDTDALYVGQTATRKDGPLGRMVDHLTDETSDRLSSKAMFWTKAYIFVFRKDGSDLCAGKSMDSLEHALTNEMPDSLCRTFKTTPEELSADYAEYLRDIKIYLYKVMPDMFKVGDNIQNKDIKEIECIKKDQLHTYNLKQDTDSVDAFTTPQSIVDEMLDQLPENVWNDKTVFLDPACKSGEFLCGILDRLMSRQDLIEKYKSKYKLYSHIISKQLFGIATNEMSYKLSKNNLDENANIACINDADYVEILKRLKIGQYGQTLFIDDNKDKVNILQALMSNLFGRSKMNIDVFIGNPPYQESISDEKKADGKKRLMPVLYNRFISLGVECAGITSLIVPARWTGESKLNSLRDSVLHSGNMKYIKVFMDGQEVFENVSTNKLCYFVYDHNYEGLTTVEFKYPDIKKVDSLQRDLKLEEGPLIENKAVYLYNKIKSRDTIQDIMYGQIYDIRTNAVLDKESSTTVKILTNNGFGCIEQNKLADNEVANKCRDSYNVFISHAMSEHAGQPDKNGQYKVIGKHGILNPGEVCTDTYLVLGAFDSKKEAENCLKYVETKFFRFLLMLKVSSVIMQPKQFNHIPMQDFSDKSNINWSDTIENIDEQLFKKYKLSEKEKKHIKSIIKPA